MSKTTSKVLQELLFLSFQQSLFFSQPWNCTNTKASINEKLIITKNLLSTIPKSAGTDSVPFCAPVPNYGTENIRGTGEFWIIVCEGERVREFLRVVRVRVREYFVFKTWGVSRKDYGKFVKFRVQVRKFQRWVYGHPFFQLNIRQ